MTHYLWLIYSVYLIQLEFHTIIKFSNSTTVHIKQVQIQKKGRQRWQFDQIPFLCLEGIFLALINISIFFLFFSKRKLNIRKIENGSSSSIVKRYIINKFIYINTIHFKINLKFNLFVEKWDNSGMKIL